jgi:hypothetical protein
MMAAFGISAITSKMSSLDISSSSLSKKPTHANNSSTSSTAKPATTGITTNVFTSKPAHYHSSSQSSTTTATFTASTTTNKSGIGKSSEMASLLSKFSAPNLHAHAAAGASSAATATNPTIKKVTSSSSLRHPTATLPLNNSTSTTLNTSTSTSTHTSKNLPLSKNTAGLNTSLNKSQTLNRSGLPKSKAGHPGLIVEAGRIDIGAYDGGLEKENERLEKKVIDLTGDTKDLDLDSSDSP